MFSGVPNFAIIIGYINASWTLGADASSRLIVRLYKYMEDNKYTNTTPLITEEEKKDPVRMLTLKSTYVKLADGNLPHAGRTGPWKPRNNYFVDSWNASRAKLEDGLAFGKVAT